MPEWYIQAGKCRFFSLSVVPRRVIHREEVLRIDSTRGKNTHDRGLKSREHWWSGVLKTHWQDETTKRDNPIGKTLTFSVIMGWGYNLSSFHPVFFHSLFQRVFFLESSSLQEKSFLIRLLLIRCRSNELPLFFNGYPSRLPCDGIHGNSIFFLGTHKII